MSYTTKNYTEQGGENTVIGGKLTVGEGGEIDIKSGAEVSGFPYSAATADKLGAVKVGNGLNVTSGGEMSVKVAAADTLGGVKVGTGLSATGEGVLSVKAAAADEIGGVKIAANQAASTAADVAGVVADLNSLIGKLKTAGIMAADAQE